MKIWANTIVNNEENFIWFALMSVVNFVDKILVWDTGSDDKTVQIINKIKEIKGEKISFKQVGEVDKYELTKMRQAQLEASYCDWILILDGDEVWWEESIKTVIKTIAQKRNKIEGIVVPVRMAIGDIYHFQDSSAGRYKILGKKGHFNLRAINRRIPDLHVDMPYPSERFLDNHNQPIQKKDKTVFLNAPYLHLTHLRRSGKSRKYDKFKYEMGKPFPKNFKLPEVLYKSYPEIVPSPWGKISGTERMKASLLTPLRKIKRRLYDR